MSTDLSRLLIKLGLSTDDSIKEFHPRVRDSEEIKVLKCEKSGVILLGDTSGSTEDAYRKMEGLSYWDGNNDYGAVSLDDDLSSQVSDDDLRRKEQFSERIYAKSWLDFGCGTGGLLRLLSKEAHKSMGFEIQPGPRKSLNDFGIQCFDDFVSLVDNSLDIITLFHVLEHLEHPVDVLRSLSSKLKPGGEMIVEVPHASDALVDLYELEAFKDFVFWSEHLMLHTKESLELFIREVEDLKVTRIEGYQRYPLSNHLYWLAKSLPGGHNVWSFLNNEQLNDAYSKVLESIDKTDTLIAYIQKKSRSS